MYHNNSLIIIILKGKLRTGTHLLIFQNSKQLPRTKANIKMKQSTHTYKEKIVIIII